MRGGNNFVDLTGKPYGLLVVLKQAEPYISPKGEKRIKWLCQCKCGNTTEVLAEALTRDYTHSCGCLKNAMLSKRTWRGYEEISGVYWGRLQNDAKKRKIEWCLTIEDAWKTFISQNKVCAITCQPLIFERNFKKYGTRQTASLDRIDSSKGYTVENIQWVHKIVNRLKWDLSQDELLYWCELICENYRTKGERNVPCSYSRVGFR